MKMNIQSVGCTVSQALLDFTEQKVSKLVRYEDEISGADIYFREEKNAGDNGKVAEIKLNVRGDELFASKSCTSFEEAVDDCLAALRRQLEKRKGRIRS